MHKSTNSKSMMSFFLLIGSLSLLSGCGGGGGGGGTSVQGSISGTAVKGPVNGATMTAYAVTNGAPGAQLARGTTDSQGNFSMMIGDYSGPVMLQMSGGTYTDEATAGSMTMANGDVMSAVIPSVSSGASVTGIQMTPLTSMAQEMAHSMTGGMTQANITTANAAIGDYFMVSDILHTAPMNPLVTGSGAGATQDMRNYGMSIAAMSQEAKDLGMTSSSSMVTAMMDDASDGVMNGMMGATGIPMGGMMGGGSMMQATAGTSGLATAMTEFINNGAANKSGLVPGDMLALINRLTASTGALGSGGALAVTMASGRAFNGPVNNAVVTAYAVGGGVMGAQLASGATDTDGNFSMALGAYSGPVMLRMSGGTYEDLATGVTMTMSPGNVMTAVIPSISTGSSVTGIQITPLTSMAQARAQYMAGGMTAANITSANTAVGGYFMAGDILHIQPMDPLALNSGTGASADAQHYGITIAAMLQYAQSIGMTDPSALIPALMDDASDGVMNGMMGSTGITMGGMGGMGGGGMMGGGTMMQSNAGTSGLATAMTDYLGLSANKSGVTITDMQTLINKLSASNGTLQ